MITNPRYLAVAVAMLSLSPLALAAQQRTLLPARDRVLPERPSQIYSIGAEDGEKWELLSGVRQVAFDARDNLYVLDGNNFRVLVFDAAGKFVREISKQGGGPGELMAPLSMTVTNDGLVVVGDLGRRGFSIFKPDGTFVKNVLFEEDEVPGLGSGLEAHPHTGVVARTAPFMMRSFEGRGRANSPNPAQLGAPTGERKSYVKWYDFGTSTVPSRSTEAGAGAGSGAQKVAQLYEFTLPSLTPRVVNGGGSGNQRQVAVTVTAPVWQPQVNFGVLPSGGIAFAHEKEYRVRLATAQGRVERIIERPIPPRKATEQDRKLALERQRENMQRGGGGRIAVRMENGRTSLSPGGPPRGSEPSIEEMLRNTTLEEFIPVIRRVDTDPQGRIWIARTPADFGERGPVDLVLANGTYIGTLASERVPDAVSRTGRAAWIERDELGVERVVVRRLPATWQ